MRLSPAHALLSAALACLALMLSVVAFAMHAPWLGLSLTSQEPSTEVVVASARGPSAAVPPGATLVSVGTKEGDALPLVATDVIEDPDFFDRFGELNTFLARQSALTRSLHRGSVRLELRDHPGEATRFVDVSPEASRPLATFPAVFWFQLFVGTAGFLFGVWVVLLRPSQPAARMFGVLGLTFPLFAFSAAVYSTRELAMDGDTVRLLSGLNHFGSSVFGMALVGLFLCYPSPLVRTRWLAVVPLVFGPWWLADLFQLVPDMDWGIRFLCMTEMAAAIVIALVQWRRARKAPQERAALLWFGLFALVGAGFFIATVVGSRALGWFPPLPQGYAFGFFLLMDVGLALGLRRFRLFDLDRWAYRTLIWVGGILVLIAIDSGLLWLTRLGPRLSLGLASVLCAFVYLPMRGFLWSKLVERGRLAEPQIFQAVLEVVFSASAEARALRWHELVRRCFDPLELTEVTQGESSVVVEEDGLSVILPAIGDISAVRLHYPWQGRGLFGSPHRMLAEQLVTLLRHAELGRESYDRGVREERVRIARDLHDDMGARLLRGLQEDTLERAQESIRYAIGDMRQIVTALAGEQVPLGDLLAEIRQETAERLATARIDLDWPAIDVPAHAQLDGVARRHYVSMLREAISNVIRHSGAKRVEVRADHDGGTLTTEITDDGVGLGANARAGHGLGHLKERAKAMGGEVAFSSASARTAITIRLPLGGGAS